MLEIDLPDVVAELVATFDAYEIALGMNDILTLNNFFLDSAFTVRYGAREGERQYSHSEIAEFRIKRGVVNRPRVLRNLRITTFGRELGVANTEFLITGSDRIGRQSQTWVRAGQDWKIVSAHVSIEHP